jgi:broad specificity phosphatase PhoE
MSVRAVSCSPGSQWLVAALENERPDWNLFRDGVPNGESPEQVAARADRFLAVVRKIDSDVAAFSSGHISRMIAPRWLGLAPLSAKYFYTATASVGILGYEHGRNQPIIVLWHDARPVSRIGQQSASPRPHRVRGLGEEP